MSGAASETAHAHVCGSPTPSSHVRLHLQFCTARAETWDPTMAKTRGHVSRLFTALLCWSFLALFLFHLSSPVSIACVIICAVMHATDRVCMYAMQEGHATVFAHARVCSVSNPGCVRPRWLSGTMCNSIPWPSNASHQSSTMAEVRTCGCGLAEQEGSQARCVAASHGHRMHPIPPPAVRSPLTVDNNSEPTANANDIQ